MMRWRFTKALPLFLIIRLSLAFVSRAIEFLFYFNLNFILKIEAICSIARII